MKKMSLIFVVGLFVSFGLSSCGIGSSSSFKKDVSTNYFTKSKIANFPLVSDLQIGAKKTMPMRLYTKTTVEAAKENILYDFMKEHNCDVVVEPMFSVETIARGMELDVKIEMTGFVANYANIRNFEPKDSARFWLEKKTKADNISPSNNVGNNVASVGGRTDEQPAKKKNGVGNIILTSLLTVGGIISLLLLL